VTITAADSKYTGAAPSAVRKAAGRICGTIVLSRLNR